MSYVVEAQIEVSASVDQAFETLCDHTRWPQWMPPTFAPLGPTVGRLTIGAKFKVRVDRMPLPSDIVVTRFVRPNEITWCGGLGALMQAEHTFFFEANGSGTRVRSSERWSGPLASVLSPFVKWRAKAGAEAQLAALAKALSAGK
jgi:hypothetical protein